MTDRRQPALYLSHGAPPLADDPRWPGQLREWSTRLGAEYGAPEAILMVSAHWEAAPVTLSSTAGAPLTYDFWGFPERYYQVRYDAPPAPELAEAVRRLLASGVPGSRIEQDQARGLDHGAYVPLVEMYPAADTPVLQLSMPTLDPSDLFELGGALAPLRDAGVLVIGSGFTTHNLAWFDPTAPADAPAPAPSVAFDAWAAQAMAGGDVPGLLNWMRQAPDPRVAHPRSEHWAPLYVALGAAAAGTTPETVSATCEIDGFWYGLSKRSWTLC